MPEFKEVENAEDICEANPEQMFLRHMIFRIEHDYDSQPFLSEQKRKELNANTADVNLNIVSIGLKAYNKLLGSFHKIAS